MLPENTAGMKTPRPGRIRGIMVLVLLAASGCGGPRSAPPPTNAEAVAALQSQFDEQMTEMVARPAGAPEQMAVFLESLAGYAEAYGPPFTTWLEQARAVRDKWGNRPGRDAVKSDLDSLRQALASPVVEP